MAEFSTPDHIPHRRLCTRGNILNRIRIVPLILHFTQTSHLNFQLNLCYGKMKWENFCWNLIGIIYIVEPWIFVGLYLVYGIALHVSKWTVVDSVLPLAFPRKNFLLLMERHFSKPPDETEHGLSIEWLIRSRPVNYISFYTLLLSEAILQFNILYVLGIQLCFEHQMAPTKFGFSMIALFWYSLET